MLQRGAKDDEDGTQWALHKCCREFLHPVMSELPLPGLHQAPTPSGLYRAAKDSCACPRGPPARGTHPS